MTAMNAVLPSCLQIVCCRSVDDTFPALMSLVSGADYRITFAKNAESCKAAEKFDEFMGLKEYVTQRRTKSGENPCDIRPFVLEGTCKETEAGYVIELKTAALKAGMLKPALWLESLCEFADCSEFDSLIYRTAILAKAADGSLVPMEAL